MKQGDQAQGDGAEASHSSAGYSSATGPRERLVAAGARVRLWHAAASPSRSAATVFVVFAIIYLATASYGENHWDTYSASVPAWKLATSGTLRVDEFLGATPWFVETEGGVYSNRFPGVIFVAAPAYLMGKVAGLVSADQLTFVPAAMTAALLTAAAVAMLYMVFHALVPREVALLAAAAMGLGTATWAVSSSALWTHGPAQLYLAMSMLAFSRSRFAGAGAAFALAAFTRPQLAVIPFVSGIYHSVRRRSVRPAAVIGVLTAGGLAGLLYYNRVIFDTWSINGGYPGHATSNLGGMTMGKYLENWLLMLASPVRGVLVFSPFLVPAILGIREAWRTAPDWVRASAVAGLTYLALQMRINEYHGGDTFFSYRLPLEALTMMAPLLLLGSLCWMQRGAERRKLFGALVVAAATLQAFGALFYGGLLTKV